MLSTRRECPAGHLPPAEEKDRLWTFTTQTNRRLYPLRVLFNVCASLIGWGACRYWLFDNVILL